MRQYKLFLFLIICSLSLFACDFQEQIDNLKNQVNELNDGRIASIDSQVENIKSSIMSMDKLDKELKALVQELSKKVTELESSDKSQAAELTKVKASLVQLEQTLDKRIDELKAYVDNELLNERDWVKATFLTLEQYQTTCNELAIIKQNLASIEENLPKSISVAVSDSEKSMKSWVNNQLTAYCTIADVDAKLKSLESLVESGDAALDEKFHDLRYELIRTKEYIKDAYEKAIKEAITDSEGRMTAKISAEIQTATETMQSKIDALWEKIADVESRIKLLENRLEELEAVINGISSLMYVPRYSDSKCVMWHGRSMDGKVVGERDTLSFEICPSGTVEQLLASTDVKLEAQAVYNTVVKSSAEMVELPVLEKFGNGNVLTVVVSGENMKDSFFSGNEGASCRVLIKTGNVEKISNYVQMRPSAIEYKAYFSSSSVSLYVGGTAMPVITVYPSPTPLTFASSDSDVFTVDDNGMLTGVKEGVAVLTMTTISGFSQTLTVNVTPMDLSSNGTANCYIVPFAGHFSFKATVKGNSNYSLDGTPTQAKVLWESYGSSVNLKSGSLISQVSFEDGKIVFNTPKVLKDGNAVIAVQDKDGKILWSWHIWICKDYYPSDTDQIYNNGAGTLMDRNLGATSAKPGNYKAIGLLYQWGRKDPFLSSSSIDRNVEAKSTITWPYPIPYKHVPHTVSYVEADPSTFLYSVEYPTTFIESDDTQEDWFYDPFGVGGYLWGRKGQNGKTIYDPCPVGYCVPSISVWTKAFGKESFPSRSVWDKTNHGINFAQSDYNLGSSDVIWYPAAGSRRGNSGDLGDDYFNYGSYWSSSPYTYGTACYFSFGSTGFVNTKYTDGNRAYARAVRCLKE